MKTSISFSNRQSMIPVDNTLKKHIRQAVKKTLEYEAFPYECEVSVTLTGNENIREMNNTYRGIDRATDVLSFPMEEDFSSVGGIGHPAVLGDIVISLEKASSQAEEYGHSFEREVSFLTVHSTLHLLGYDHETGEEDEKDMFSRQKEIMKSLGF